MNTSSFWFEGAGGPGPSPTPVPGTANSLRFRGAQWLQRSGTTLQADSTISFWFKYAISTSPTAEQMLFGNSSSNTFFEIYANSTPNSHMLYSNLGGYGGTISTSPSLRDPSAWYHLVVQSTASTNTVWLNGVQVATGSSFGTANYTNFIGKNSSSSNFFNGYMADWYAIDGQALEPTAFGRYNDDEVWVPREVDFTPATMRYSDLVYTTPKSSIDWNTTSIAGFATADAGGYGREEMFNNNNTVGICDSAADAVVFRPSEPIENITTLEIQVGGSQYAQTSFDVCINGNNTVVQTINNANANLNSPVATPVSIPVAGGTLSSLAIYETSGSGDKAGWCKITVNGQVLTNPFLWSAELFTQTTNTATPDYNSTEKNFNNPAVNAFDGATGTSASSSGSVAQGWLHWRPSTAIKVNSSLRVSCQYSTQTIQVNEVTNGNNSNSNGTAAWVDLSGDLTFPFDLSVLSLRGAGTSASGAVSAWLGAVEIDGQILVDGVNNSYGANGFHLTFENPSNIGKDYSGNGNDFTAIEFNTNYPGNFSSYVTTNTSWNDANAPFTPGEINYIWKGGCADGDCDSMTWVFEPPTPIALNGQTLKQGTGGTTYGQTKWTYTYEDANGTEFTKTLGWLSSTGVAFQDVVTGNYFLKKVEMYYDGPYSGSSNNGGLIGFWLDNTKLVNNTGTDYDLMQDGPSQNWATLNPLQVVENKNTHLSNANLTAQNNTSAQIKTATIEIPAGKWYWEQTTTQSTEPSYPLLGISKTNVPSVFAGRDSQLTSIFYGATGNLFEFTNSNTGTSYGDSYGVGDVIGTAYDANTGELEFFKNGVSQGVAATVSADFRLAMMPSGSYGYNSNNTVSVNFGQQPFLFQPAGTVALQTQNLPAATIKDGREHFQAITGPGDGPSSINPATQIPVNSYTNPSGYLVAATDYNTYQGFNADSGTYFFVPANTDGETTPSIVFDTPMTGTKFEIFVSTLAASKFFVNGQEISTGQISSVWYDFSAQAAGSLSSLGFSATGVASDGFAQLKIDDKQVIEAGILPLAQQTFPNGLWWIKDMVNANQHQLVDSVRGGNLALQCPNISAETAYVPPSGSSVAWSWKAGDSVVQNNDGTITTQVSANTTSGFSIIKWSGTGADVQWGHGLTKAPEFTIIKDRSGTGSFEVTVQGIAERLRLNSATENDAGGGSVVTTDSVIYPVDSAVVSDNWNAVGSEYVCYAWASVPGYSAFGSYTGNNDSDGPFIYTGFRPALIILRPINSANSWLMIDTTINANNPCNITLSANVTSKEDSSTERIDILSNGFKNISGLNGTNGNQDYLYCAWAENPFGGSNVSPANAR